MNAAFYHVALFFFPFQVFFHERTQRGSQHPDPFGPALVGVVLAKPSAFTDEFKGEMQSTEQAECFLSAEVDRGICPAAYYSPRLPLVLLYL